ncbi:MAG: AAA family ATPase [Methylocystis sp.]|uniref:AAA family ATPase n=1 Tax=Methylocystis sp. TaxID=1911079 RepID=UPI003DA53651
MASFNLIDAIQTSDVAAVLAERNARVAKFVKRHAEAAPNYIASPELIAAVNVALSLGRPLLLTGEPGSGKTQAAYWLAWKFGIDTANGRFHRFQVRSDSRAAHLIYRYDAASWFRASQIAQSGPRPHVPKDLYITPGPLGLAFGWHDPPAEPHAVLIDEIDKAPRDFPNDLLQELEDMQAVVREDGYEKTISCPAEARPIIVITSNAERRLPDPFLRRCVLHEIRLSADTIAKIFASQIEMALESPLDAPKQDALTAAVGFYQSRLHDLRRKPTVDQFWRWLALALHYGGRTPAEIAAALNADAGAPPLRELPYIATLFDDPDLSKLSPKPAAP